MWHADEQEWMWDLFPGKYALCRVFALLYGIKSWRGSYRQLARVVRIPETTVYEALKQLQTGGFIQCTQNGYTCSYTEHDRSLTEQLTSKSEQKCSLTKQKCSPTEPLPPTPPITKNNMKEMKVNEKIAHETIATPDPKDLFSFSQLLAAYRLRAGDYQIAPAILNDARGIWGAYPEWKRTLLLAELRKPDGWLRPRLDWTLTAFDPKPTDYNRHDPGTFPNEPMVIAKHNGNAGIFTAREAELYQMTDVKPFKL